MKYLWKIKTKSSIILGSYSWPRYTWDCLTSFSYPEYLNKWERPVWFWQVIITRYWETLRLCNITDITTYIRMSPDTENKVLDYVNNGDLALVWFLDWIGVVYEGYFTIENSGSHIFVNILTGDRIKEVLESPHFTCYFD